MNDIIDSYRHETFQIPKWLKYFSILFGVVGLVIPIIVILNLIDYRPELAIYGLESNSIFNTAGILVLSVFLIKSIVGYGIMKREKWAFNLAIFDAILGITICILNFGLRDLINNNPNINFEIRLELLLLIPYLIYTLRNKSNWKNQYYK